MEVGDVWKKATARYRLRLCSQFFYEPFTVTGATLIYIVSWARPIYHARNTPYTAPFWTRPPHVGALMPLPYRSPNSTGHPFDSWHDTILTRSKHGLTQSVTGPGRHGPFSGPGMSSYGGPRALARPDTIYGSARRRPAI